MIADPIKQAVSIDMLMTAYDFIAGKDEVGLSQMGLDVVAVECLIQLKNTDFRLASYAFEQALSIQTYVDPSILRRALLNNSRKKNEEELLNNFIKAGAGFGMIRHFFKNHTNRKHTSLRQEFGMDNVEVSGQKITSKAADAFFSELITKNKVINAKDIFEFAQKEKYLLRSVWTELNKFTENGE